MPENDYLRERFDEVREALRELRAELLATRHGLKGSVDTMAVVQAEHVVEIKNLDKRADRFEEALLAHAKEHEGRLRVMEDIAASIREVPARLARVEQETLDHRPTVARLPLIEGRLQTECERIDKLEKQVDSAGRFTWSDVYRVVAAIAALATVVGLVVNRAG